jgi:hypothetical protein
MWHHRLKNPKYQKAAAIANIEVKSKKWPVLTPLISIITGPALTDRRDLDIRGC